MKFCTVIKLIAILDISDRRLQIAIGTVGVDVDTPSDSNTTLTTKTRCTGYVVTASLDTSGE